MRAGEHGAGIEGRKAGWAICLVAGLLGLILGARMDTALAAELVMFEDAGCSWCRRFHQEIGPVYPRSEEGRRAPLRTLDISDAPRSGLRLAQRVNVTPTFVLVAEGIEVGRITGYPGQDFFWGLLGELLARLPDARVLPPSNEALRLEPATVATRSRCRLRAS
jgi:hypothetical protein